MSEAASLPASALLRLIWLASPALPVGGFSYSEGLEAAVDAGLVGDEAGAADWIADQLHLSLARSDLAVIAQAIPAWQARDLPRLQALDAWVLHSRESAEFRLQTSQMGRSFVEWLRAQDAQAASHFQGLAPTYPLAFAFEAARTGAPMRDALLAFAFGWAENTMQSAIKAVPLGQSAGQRILARLADEIPQAVDHAMQLGDEDRQACAPMLAILSARHEIQYSRLFRS